MATNRVGNIEGLRKLRDDIDRKGERLSASDKSRMVEAGIRELGLEMEIFYRGGEFFRLSGRRIHLEPIVKADQGSFETIVAADTEI